MANESKKDFNVMMNNNKDMPKIQIVEDEKIIKKYGGTKMFFAPPIYYDELMKKVPKGKLITVSVMRDYLAKTNNADFTDPMTAGIFVNIVAWASYQRDEDITPYWRTLKSDGELNVKYPEGIKLQKVKQCRKHWVCYREFLRTTAYQSMGLVEPKFILTTEK